MGIARPVVFGDARRGRLEAEVAGFAVGLVDVHVIGDRARHRGPRQGRRGDAVSRREGVRGRRRQCAPEHLHRRPGHSMAGPVVAAHTPVDARVRGIGRRARVRRRVGRDVVDRIAERFVL